MAAEQGKHDAVTAVNRSQHERLAVVEDGDTGRQRFGAMQERCGTRRARANLLTASERVVGEPSALTNPHSPPSRPKRRGFQHQKITPLAPAPTSSHNQRVNSLAVGLNCRPDKDKPGLHFRDPPRASATAAGQQVGAERDAKVNVLGSIVIKLPAHMNRRAGEIEHLLLRPEVGAQRGHVVGERGGVCVCRMLRVITPNLVRATQAS